MARLIPPLQHPAQHLLELLTGLLPLLQYFYNDDGLVDMYFTDDGLTEPLISQDF